MSTMIFEVYDALKEAGATEDKARKAAGGACGPRKPFQQGRGRFEPAEVDGRLQSRHVGRHPPQTVRLSAASMRGWADRDFFL